MSTARPMVQLEMFAGEVGKIFEFTIEYEDPNNPGTYIPRDLSGATVTLRAERNPVKTLTLITPGSGRCDYTVEAGDFEVPGVYQAVIHMEGLTGDIDTYTELYEFKVRPVPGP